MSERLGTTDVRNTVFLEESKVMSHFGGVQKLLPWREDRHIQTPRERVGHQWYCDLYLNQQICWILTGPRFILAVRPRKATEIKSRWGLLGGFSGKEPDCQCRKHKTHGLDRWVGKIPWSRKRQPTPAFLPGESHSRRSLAGSSPWGLKELDMTEVT